MNNLIKRSDVEKRVGVTRRKLQWYNQIGLLSPSFINESNGFWYYDEKTIMKLEIIEILHEIGYKNDIIKSIVNSNEIITEKVWSNAIKKLNEKKKEIDGQIILIETYKMLESFDLPDYICELIVEFDLLPLFSKVSQDSNFVIGFDENVSDVVRFNKTLENYDVNLNNQEVSLIYFYIFKVILIFVIIAGLYKKLQPYDNRVQSCFDYIISNAPNWRMEENSEIEIFICMVREILKEKTCNELISNIIEEKNNEGVYNYFDEVMEYYLNNNEEK